MEDEKDQEEKTIQEKYNEHLTAVDSGHDIRALEQAVPAIRQLQATINELIHRAPAPAKSGWRGWLQRFIHGELQRQRELDATVIHLLNELIEYLAGSTQRIRQLLEAQILYFQQITPWMDEKMDDLRQEQRTALERKLQEIWFQLNKLRPSTPALKVGEYDLSRLRIELDELKQRLSPLTAAKPEAKPAKYDFPVADDFRYHVFEEIFRGSSESLTENLKRYVPHFITAPEPILDIGCGRGEFLQLMKELGKKARGIELNHYEAKKLKESGFDLIEQDALAYLDALEQESVGSVFCAQVVEHLAPDQVFHMLSRLSLVMKPGSSLLIETVNPLSVFGFHHVYFKDPTHLFPVHPETLAFMMRYAGFQNVNVELTAPLPEKERLPLPDEKVPDTKLREYLDQIVIRLNTLLYDPVEYFAVGTRP